VAIAFVCSNGQIMVNPQMRDFLEDHIHYSVDLVALPAGDHTSPGPDGLHVITNADSTLEGWLPADDPVFDGKAPTGAKFGYNLSAQTELDQLWPPIPSDAALLEMQHKSVFDDIKGTHVDAVLDFPSVASNSFEELSVTVAGASIDDTATASVQGGPTADGVIQAWVSAADTVTVRYTNPSGGAIDPPSSTYHITVFKDPVGPDAVATSFKGFQRVAYEHVTIDANGIWWMTACYNEVPWYADLNTITSSSSLSSSSSSLSSQSSSASVEDCPVDRPFLLKLSFIKMVFATDKTVVTSLQPAEDSPIEVLGCDGQAAKTGDLKLALNLAFLIDQTDVEGFNVFKELTAEGKFNTGPIVEGLRAGSNVSLSGTPNPTDEELIQGVVTIDVDTDPAERELPPQIIRLGDARERFLAEIPYIGFPASADSGVRLKFVVPPLGLPTTPKLKLRTLLLGTATGTFPDLTMTYRRLPRPTGGGEESLPLTDSPLTYTTTVSITINSYKELESAEFTIAPGDTVFVFINRADGDGYAGEVGLLRSGGVIVAG
jgi:hypothetical protein